jgi:ParB/RepB/Spo0J family partition protein
MPVEANGILGRNTMFYQINSRAIVVDTDFNLRQNFDEERQQELVDFMSTNGVPGTLLVRKDGTNIVLVDGHRRLRAINTLREQGIDIDIVTAEFEKKDVTPAERLITAMSRNEGERLTPFEEAEGFRRLSVVQRWTQTQIAQRIGKSPSYVAQRLSLLHAPPELAAAHTNGAVTTTEAVKQARNHKNGSVPVSPEEKLQKTFTKTLDKMGLNEAVLAFIAYATKEELEFLVAPLTLALAQLKAHGFLSNADATPRLMWDEDND